MVWLSQQWRREEDVVAMSVSPVFYRSHVVTWKLPRRAWSLDTSVMLTNHDNIGGAMFVPVNSIDILRSHSAEAAKQLNNLDEASLKGINWFQMSSQIWR